MYGGRSRFHDRHLIDRNRNHLDIGDTLLSRPICPSPTLLSTASGCYPGRRVCSRLVKVTSLPGRIRRQPPGVRGVRTRLVATGCVPVPVAATGARATHFQGVFGSLLIMPSCLVSDNLHAKVRVSQPQMAVARVWGPTIKAQRVLWSLSPEGDGVTGETNSSTKSAVFGRTFHQAGAKAPAVVESSA